MKKLLFTVVVGIVSLVSASAQLDYNVVRTAIFGSGNPDVGWTEAKNELMALSLRAKNRELSSPASTANTSGVYPQPTGLLAPAMARARWNFEWSITVLGGGVVSDYDYFLGIDNDVSTAPNYNYINPEALLDNSYGDLSTFNGQGVENTSMYLGNQYSVSQQSHNITFYPALGFNPLADATYDFELYAVAKGAGQNGARLLTVTIKVVVGQGGPAAPDDDGDGVANYLDQCPNTPLIEVADANGCSVFQWLDMQCRAANPDNHGEYVSCMVQKANEMLKQGQVTKEQRNAIAKKASHTVLSN